jgi:hypothetical protein
MVSRKAGDKEVFLAPKALSPSFSYMIAFPAQVYLQSQRAVVAGVECGPLGQGNVCHGYIIIMELVGLGDTWGVST